VANEVIVSEYGLSLPEKRLVFYCLAHIDSLKTEITQYKFSVTAVEFAMQFNLEVSTSYEQLQAIADSLTSRKLRIMDVSANDEVSYEQIVWVSRAKYFLGKGKLEINFSPELTPFLRELGKNRQYTSYKLKFAASLRTINGWKLFDLLMRFQSTGKYIASLQEFCHAMEVPDSYRKDFGQIARLINRAVDDIEKNHGLEIQWTPEKDGGRQYRTITFKFPSTKSVKKTVKEKKDVTDDDEEF